MTKYTSVSALLDAQPEEKLLKMRERIVADIERLGRELKIVEGALAQKHRAPIADGVAS